MGAVAARAVRADLHEYGHDVVELERGSTETKLWKEVKRKRVRIPDLVCRRCGQRIECRAKAKPELSMSHSATDAERAWDYGMVDGDWIAFPVCTVVEETFWGAGRLRGTWSYWHERDWATWQVGNHVNYFTVGALRSVPPDAASTKGVTEGTETAISWSAVFSTRDGSVDAASRDKVTVRRTPDGHRQTWTARRGQQVVVRAGDAVRMSQVLAAPMPPVTREALACPGALAQNRIARLLGSRERTQRFTGVKLARVLGDASHSPVIEALATDEEEDVYVRLEAVCYLALMGVAPLGRVISPYLQNPDAQTQLEAVITLAEAATDEAVEILAAVVHNPDQPGFLRAASAWSLARIGGLEAGRELIRAFAAVPPAIREEALDGMVALGQDALGPLLDGLRRDNDDIAAGCAEVLRQQEGLPEEVVADLARELAFADPDAVTTKWMVWLMGHLPIDPVASGIARLQEARPELHYAMSVLWSFTSSWISHRWELHPGPVVRPN
jgi:hypothetical protein